VVDDPRDSETSDGVAQSGDSALSASERLASSDPETITLTLEELRALYAALARRARNAKRADPPTVQALGQLVDLAGDLRRPRGLRLAVATAVRLLEGASDPFIRGLLHYFAANAWSHMRVIRRRPHGANPVFSWDEPEGVEEVAHLRAAEEAFAEVDATSPAHDGAWARRRQVLTNLGNALNAGGRLIEAIEAWDAALALDPSFGMALGNRGMGLEWYTTLAYDPGHQRHLIREAHRSLAASEVASGVDPNAAEVFAQIKAHIESRVHAGVLEKPESQWTPERPWSGEERAYRTWCAKARLFLNDLNDIRVDARAMADVLMLPSLVTPLDEGPALLGFFNQLKQEYVAARWLLYRGMHGDEVHFADRDVTLVNTLDYPVYSIAAEEAKLAYRSFYSLFDKIAFFLNDYFVLGIPERAVSFKTLWYDRREQKHGPRADLTARRNAPLRALYWLSQDLFAPGERSSDLGAQRMAEIRQELEHKYLKLHENNTDAPGRRDRPGEVSHDRIAYSLGAAELHKRALRLARLVRAALLYLAFAVRVEERDREELRSPGSLSLPMAVPLWDDDWKR
jgi:tetratricopeptide (TPR) repeat protein